VLLNPNQSINQSNLDPTGELTAPPPDPLADGRGLAALSPRTPLRSRPFGLWTCPHSLAADWRYCPQSRKTQYVNHIQL